MCNLVTQKNSTAVKVRRGSWLWLNGNRKHLGSHALWQQALITIFAVKILIIVNCICLNNGSHVYLHKMWCHRSRGSSVSSQLSCFKSKHRYIPSLVTNLVLIWCRINYTFFKTWKFGQANLCIYSHKIEVALYSRFLQLQYPLSCYSLWLS